MTNTANRSNKIMTDNQPLDLAMAGILVTSDKTYSQQWRDKSLTGMSSRKIRV